MLEVFVTAKVLPVGILQKTANHRLVTLIEGMFQIVKPNHQVGRQTWAAEVLHEQLANLVIKESPVDLVGNLEERVLPIEDLIQPGKEQFALVFLGR